MRIRAEIEDLTIDELSDADIEALLIGRAIDRIDLTALSGFLAELRSLRRVDVGQEFVAFHASEAADLAGSVEIAAPPLQRPYRRLRPWAGLRRRVTATGMSLVMLLGATGVAWASDTAVPGDWNYGIDRALEAIGIGAGGFAERVQETRGLFAGEPDHQVGEGVTAELPPNDLARFTATEHQTDLPGGADEAHAKVDRIHQYQDGAEKVDGRVVSDLAREGARGLEEKPEKTGKEAKPETADKPAKPAKPEKSEKPEKGSNRP